MPCVLVSPFPLLLRGSPDVQTAGGPRRNLRPSCLPFGPTVRPLFFDFKLRIDRFLIAARLLRTVGRGRGAWRGGSRLVQHLAYRVERRFELANRGLDSVHIVPLGDLAGLSNRVL